MDLKLFLDHRSSHWVVESTKIGGEILIETKYTKYSEYCIIMFVDDNVVFMKVWAESLR